MQRKLSADFVRQYFFFFSLRLSINVGYNPFCQISKFYAFSFRTAMSAAPVSV